MAIPKDTVDQIIFAARIEEVVGDFIRLKKRGANLLGLCPFHGERSPSFTVSPAKGIYKCFGCGKSGNSVGFIMEHEQMTFPEALRHLAIKYNIKIEEKEVTEEERAAQTEKESLMIVMAFAQKYYTTNLWDTEEGKSIGLSYFRERGFTDTIIEKFQLGYSFELRDAFTKKAIEMGYQKEYLVKAGVSIAQTSEDGTLNYDRIFDRYAGRVIFPIHSVTGRVIGLGGRIMKDDKKFAKYINSPESEIYNKSKTLYGLFQAKKVITNADICYLVEGYTDVIAMHQSGVENVVASSGTSLTTEQIKLIHRYTNNITILYDGDFAGIKASFRGIDMILEEGMNVKVLLFPDGEDPDSYSKKLDSLAFQTYIKDNTKDFIAFKCDILIKEASGDPIKQAQLIKEVVQSVALIPDTITRSVYIKTSARIFQTDEQIIVSEINKLRKNKYREDQKQKNNEGEPNGGSSGSIEDVLNQEKAAEANDVAYDDLELSEKAIIQCLLHYGDCVIEEDFESTTEAGEQQSHTVELTVADYIIFELERDALGFSNPMYKEIYEHYLHHIAENRVIPQLQYFTSHSNAIVSSMSINLTLDTDKLSANWEKYGILIPEAKDNIHHIVKHNIWHFKQVHLSKLIHIIQNGLNGIANENELFDKLGELKSLKALQMFINKNLGRTITR
jgi:DNA primase